MAAAGVYANLTYADENVACSPYLTQLRLAIRQETEEKVAREGRS